uniref:cDNA FLJ26896 fis, clone RCT00464 n=1 Tax=Homo sapiens TaxID=9606 RepID=Q6ZNY0_HUMAN|nr:unnamed protein product [Homo sapiens]
MRRARLELSAASWCLLFLLSCLSSVYCNPVLLAGPAESYFFSLAFQLPLFHPVCPPPSPLTTPASAQSRPALYPSEDTLPSVELELFLWSLWVHMTLHGTPLTFCPSNKILCSFEALFSVRPSLAPNRMDHPPLSPGHCLSVMASPLVTFLQMCFIFPLDP